MAALDLLVDLNQGLDHYQSGDTLQLGAEAIEAFLINRRHLYHTNRVKQPKESHYLGRPLTVVSRKEYYKCRWFRKPKTKALQTSPSKRRVRAAPMAAACPCRFHVTYPTEANGLATVQWFGSHNHPRGSAKQISQTRLFPEIQAWLTARIAEGKGWRELRDLLRFDPQQFEDVWQKKGLVPAAMLVKPHHIRNMIRAALETVSRKHKELWQSLLQWLETIRAEGGWGLAERNLAVGGSQVFGWMFAFCTKWQRKLLSQQDTNVCLDSTHGTCIGVTTGDKVYLYTLCKRSRQTGRGVPVAFMLTNSEASPPLTLWLRGLRDQLAFCSPTFTIDCSATEVAALSSVFPTSHILFCYWHVLRAVNKAAMSKVRFKQTVSSSHRQAKIAEIKQGFRTCLLQPRCAAEFQIMWNRYLDCYAEHSEWVSYCERQWCQREASGSKLAFAAHWAQFGRTAPHGGTDTNNLIERWHGILKSVYLNKGGKHRADYLVFALVRKALVDFEIQELQASNGIVGYTLSRQELKSRAFASKLRAEELEDMVDDTPESGLQVRSFTKPETWYRLSTTTVYKEATPGVQRDILQCHSCTCLSFQTTNLKCKHMFAAARCLQLELWTFAPSCQPTQLCEPHTPDSDSSTRISTNSGVVREASSYSRAHQPEPTEVAASELDCCAQSIAKTANAEVFRPETFQSLLGPALLLVDGQQRQGSRPTLQVATQDPTYCSPLQDTMLLKKLPTQCDTPPSSLVAPQTEAMLNASAIDIVRSKHRLQDQLKEQISLLSKYSSNLTVERCSRTDLTQWLQAANTLRLALLGATD